MYYDSITYFLIGLSMPLLAVLAACEPIDCPEYEKTISYTCSTQEDVTTCEEYKTCTSMLDNANVALIGLGNG